MAGQGKTAQVIFTQGRAVGMWEGGVCAEDIAKVLGVTSRSVWRWVRRWHMEGFVGSKTTARRIITPEKICVAMATCRDKKGNASIAAIAKAVGVTRESMRRYINRLRRPGSQEKVKSKRRPRDKASEITRRIMAICSELYGGDAGTDDNLPMDQQILPKRNSERRGRSSGHGGKLHPASQHNRKK